MAIQARGDVRASSIDIKIIRANGQVEDLGTVSYWHRNPLRRLAWRLFGWKSW